MNFLPDSMFVECVCNECVWFKANWVCGFLVGRFVQHQVMPSEICQISCVRVVGVIDFTVVHSSVCTSVQAFGHCSSPSPFHVHPGKRGALQGAWSTGMGSGSAKFQLAIHSAVFPLGWQC